MKILNARLLLKCVQTMSLTLLIFGIQSLTQEKIVYPQVPEELQVSNGESVSPNDYILLVQNTNPPFRRTVRQGSATIIRVTQEELVIVTNAHVLSNSSSRSEPNRGRAVFTLQANQRFTPKSRWTVDLQDVDSYIINPAWIPDGGSSIVEDLAIVVLPIESAESPVRSLPIQEETLGAGERVSVSGYVSDGSSGELSFLPSVLMVIGEGGMQPGNEVAIEYTPVQEDQLPVRGMSGGAIISDENTLVGIHQGCWEVDSLNNNCGSADQYYGVPIQVALERFSDLLSTYGLRENEEMDEQNKPSSSDSLLRTTPFENIIEEPNAPVRGLW